MLLHQTHTDAISCYLERKKNNETKFLHLSWMCDKWGYLDETSRLTVMEQQRCRRKHVGQCGRSQWNMQFVVSKNILVRYYCSPLLLTLFSSFTLSLKCNKPSCWLRFALQCGPVWTAEGRFKETQWLLVVVVRPLTQKGVWFILVEVLSSRFNSPPD